MNATAPPIVVEDLSFRYQSREDLALKNISFTAQAGELLLIAGTSGCGKTTLARCINGLIPRSYKGDLTGRILVMGEETRDWQLARISQRIATVLQDPERQILGSRVLNEVAFGLENLALPREEVRARAEDALARLGIAHLAKRETFTLSGGEKQKVALAGVLAMRPSILLLDEPLASLDPASAQETLALVRSLANEGMTVLMVEHRVEDVLSIQPDRVMFMQAGEIRYLGAPEHLEEHVDYHEVKLPADQVMHRAAHQQVTPKPLPALTRTLHKQSVAQETTPLVQFKDVRFGYDAGQVVLKSVNLDIHRGDVIAILGPNGAGKTTLVKHAIGLLKPKSGQVLVNGKSTHEQSVAQVAKTLGYVFQSPSHMLFAPSVEEELAFGPKNMGHSAETIQKEVQEAIHIVNLDGFEKNPPLALSFGQQKRVSIAAILAMRSRILVMDEPTAGQDYKNYIDFMDSIVQIPSFEAIIFITHDVDMAVIYANRVLLVGNGQVVADGKPAEVLADFERLRACRVIPSSLLRVNLQHYGQTGRFLRAEELAHAAQPRA